jgi:hypothetical protein
MRRHFSQTTIVRPDVIVRLFVLGSGWFPVTPNDLAHSRLDHAQYLRQMIPVNSFAKNWFFNICVHVPVFILSPL